MRHDGARGRIPLPGRSPGTSNGRRPRFRRAAPKLPRFDRASDVCYAAIMQLCDVFQHLGEDGFAQLIRGISMGRLRTYQLFDTLKARAHLVKLNTEHLRHATPRLWTRIQE